MTAVVAFTFGSLGDIISLLQVVNSVRTALYDTRGASAEYRDLLAELDSLVYTIASVQRMLSIQGPDRMSQSVENGLHHAMHVCLRLLAHANERVAAFRSSTTSNLWRRVGWMLVRKDEVVALRLRLSEQTKAMDTLLTLAQGDRLNSVAHQVDRVADRVDRAIDQMGGIDVAVHEQHALIVEIHRCVRNWPRRMGYFWEGDPDAEALPVRIQFTDNHIITVPLELCATKQLLQEFVAFYLRNPHEVKTFRSAIEPGNVIVKLGKTNLPHHQFLSKHSFVVKPGATVHFMLFELTILPRKGLSIWDPKIITYHYSTLNLWHDAAPSTECVWPLVGSISHAISGSEGVARFMDHGTFVNRVYRYVSPI